MALREPAVRATGRFAQDLDDSVKYYLEHAGERSARRFLDEYDKFCDLVSTFPGYGPVVGDTDLRWRKVGVFVAVYSTDADAGEVVLLRLYYLSSDWRREVLGNPNAAEG